MIFNRLNFVNKKYKFVNHKEDIIEKFDCY